MFPSMSAVGSKTDSKGKDIEFESAIAVWASVFAHEITHAHLKVYYIYVAAFSGNEASPFTFAKSDES